MGSESYLLPTPEYWSSSRQSILGSISLEILQWAPILGAQPLICGRKIGGRQNSTNIMWVHCHLLQVICNFYSDLFQASKFSLFFKLSLFVFLLSSFYPRGSFFAYFSGHGVQCPSFCKCLKSWLLQDESGLPSHYGWVPSSCGEASICWGIYLFYIKLKL